MLATSFSAAAFWFSLGAVFVVLAIAACLFIRSALVAIRAVGRDHAHPERGRAAPWFWSSALCVAFSLVGIVLIVVRF